MSEIDARKRIDELFAEHCKGVEVSPGLKIALHDAYSAAWTQGFSDGLDRGREIAMEAIDKFGGAK